MKVRRAQPEPSAHLHTTLPPAPGMVGAGGTPVHFAKRYAPVAQWIERPPPKR